MIIRFIPTLCILLATAAAAQQSTSEVTVPFFGNKACPITGKPSKPSLSVKHGDEKIFVCCKSCVAKVTADTAAAHKKAYPASSIVDVKNAKCPIMGGKAKASVTTIFQGHRVRFCCPGCDSKFGKEPNKHLARLTAKKTLTDLKNKKCPIMHDNAVLPDSFLIYDNQIVNICCSGCVEKFAKDPKGHLAALKKGKKHGEHKDHKDH